MLIAFRDYMARLVGARRTEPAPMAAPPSIEVQIALARGGREVGFLWNTQTGQWVLAPGPSFQSRRREDLDV